MPVRLWARTSIATSVATWSLRERAVCSLAPGVADDLGEPALDRHVHVLVVGLDLEPVLVDLRADLGEAALDLGQVVLADDLAAGEHPRVRERLLEVVGRQAEVERDRRVQRLEQRVLWLGEAGHGRGSLRAHATVAVASAPGCPTRASARSPVRPTMRPRRRRCSTRARAGMYDRYAGNRELAERALAARARRSDGHHRQRRRGVGRRAGRPAWRARWPRCPTTSGPRAPTASCASRCAASRRGAGRARCGSTAPAGGPPPSPRRQCFYVDSLATAAGTAPPRRRPRAAGEAERQARERGLRLRGAGHLGRQQAGPRAVRERRASRRWPTRPPSAGCRAACRC